MLQDATLSGRQAANVVLSSASTKTSSSNVINYRSTVTDAVKELGNMIKTRLSPKQQQDVEITTTNNDSLNLIHKEQQRTTRIRKEEDQQQHHHHHQQQQHRDKMSIQNVVVDNKINGSKNSHPDKYVEKKNSSDSNYQDSVLLSSVSSSLAHETERTKSSTNDTSPLNASIKQHSTSDEMSSSSAVAAAAVVEASANTLTSTEIMFIELSHRFPGTAAACLDELNFSDFKAKALSAKVTGGGGGGTNKQTSSGNKQGGGNGNGGNGGASGSGGGGGGNAKNEPFFKIFGENIRVLQTSQSIYDQYIKAMTSCYQSVLTQVTNEMINLEMKQEKRLQQLEGKMHELISNQKNDTACSLDNHLESLMLMINTASSKIGPLYHDYTSNVWYIMTRLYTMMSNLIRMIMASMIIQEILNYIVIFKRELISFVGGTLFCISIFSLSNRNVSHHQDTKMVCSQSLLHEKDNVKSSVKKRRRKKKKIMKKISTDSSSPPVNVVSSTDSMDNYSQIS